jgi:hypothetical protein
MTANRPVRHNIRTVLSGSEILSLHVSYDLIPTCRRSTQILVITDKSS